MLTFLITYSIFMPLIMGAVVGIIFEKNTSPCMDVLLSKKQRFALFSFWMATSGPLAWVLALIAGIIFGLSKVLEYFIKRIK